MSLIKQLGGYKCAAYEYKNTLLADDFPYVIKATGTKFTRPELGDELLEYRRQYNIFEENDKIVFVDNFMHGELMTVAWTRVGEVWMDDGAKRCTELTMIRHATDDEIKAGKRLEVNDAS